MSNINKVIDRFFSNSQKELVDYTLKEYENLIHTAIEPDFKFFKYGSMEIEALDPKSRQISIIVCMPYCIMQTITPFLLENGIIDKFVVHNPVNVWMPSLSNEDFLEQVTNSEPNIVRSVNLAVNEQINGVLKIFSDASKIAKDPYLLTPLLPIGIYVDFRYRSTVDNLAEIILNLNNVQNMRDVQVTFVSIMVYSLYKLEIMTAAKSK